MPSAHFATVGPTVSPSPAWWLVAGLFKSAFESAVMCRDVGDSEIRGNYVSSEDPSGGVEELKTYAEVVKSGSKLS